jgi:hypothetical protein
LPGRSICGKQSEAHCHDQGMMGLTRVLVTST